MIRPEPEPGRWPDGLAIPPWGDLICPHWLAAEVEHAARAFGPGKPAKRPKAPKVAPPGAARLFGEEAT